MFDYRVPGVYRQEVTLRAKSRLPTGVPGFVGFADSRYDGETSYPLAALPDRLLFSDELGGKVRYDSARRLLIFKGAMSCADRLTLLSLSNQRGFTESVTALYTQSQGEAIWNLPIVMYRQADFDAKFAGRDDSYLADAVKGFFGNGGLQCFVVRAEPCVDPETALTNALESLAPLNDLDLVAAPDAMTLRVRDGAGVLRLDEAAITRVQRAALSHCSKHQGRFAILDARSGLIASDAIAQRNALLVGGTEPVNGALYYPWLRTSGGRLVPPCGHVAGIYSRSDAKAGYFKAPANEEIRDVVDIETPVDNDLQDQLNPEGVNCIRTFPGRGVRVWGARTISRDPAWRYINVRRLFLTLQRWVDLNMAWAGFEPNTPRLWVRITRELSAFLSGLWKSGGLTGQTAEQAFYVKCDNETNPPEEREQGRTITEIGLAPSSPAEFVVVRIVHHTGVEPR